MDWHNKVREHVWRRSQRNEKTPLVNGAHCLDWVGALNSKGYPVMKLGGVCVLVTRYVLAHTVRRFRQKEEALHHCDRPSCIEPLHLHHGTKSQNMREMWARGRRYKTTTFLFPDN